MNRIWNNYKELIRRNCLPSHICDKDVIYWQNYLFSNTIIAVIPLSIITVIPGIAFSVHSGLYFLAFLDVVAFFLLILIGFGPGLNQRQRKFLFIFCIYFVTGFLLVYTGISGPAQLFLFAATIFGILMLPTHYAYLWSWLTTAIVLLFVPIVHFDLSPVSNVNDLHAPEWLAISANLVFLSFLCSALIPRLFKGISESIENYKITRHHLELKTTEQENLLEEIRTKNEELELFASIASHDLQEPLRMVTSFLGKLEKKYNSLFDERAKTYIRFATDGAHRMKQLILDLLDYTKASKSEIVLEQVDLRLLLEDYKKINADKLVKQQAEINYSELPVLNTSRVLISQVITNLLDNAVKYTAPGTTPKIYINTKEKNNEWLFEVLDNGIGIEQEFFDKIFVLFKRLHNNDEYHGTGIGLALVKKNVERLGGRIWVESIKGKGSTFYFRLPK